MTYLANLFIFLSVYAILAWSLNIVTGYAGLLTLAHASFFATGAYAYSLLSLKAHLGFLPATVSAAIIAAVLSLIVSLPAWRFRGDFFVVATLAVQAMMAGLLRNWFSPHAEPGTWANLSNGTFGLSDIPKPTIGGIELTSWDSTAIVAAVILVICGSLCWLLFHSPWGRLLRAIRDDELATRGLGKNTRLVKLQAFAISCALAAVAGAIYASHVNYIDPSLASLDQSILILSMLIVGGAGNFRGPFLGALFLLLMPEALRVIALPDVVAANLRLMVYGVLLVLLMHFRPQGFAGIYRME